MMEVGIGWKSLMMTSGQLNRHPHLRIRARCFDPEVRLPATIPMTFSPHRWPAHHQTRSNFITPGKATRIATARDPLPTRANAAAAMIDSVDPLRNSPRTGCVPTSAARNGRSASRYRPEPTMAAQQAMSVLVGLPLHGRRGSSQGLFSASAFASAGIGSSVCGSVGCRASGWMASGSAVSAMAASASLAFAGSSITPSRYPGWRAGDNRSTQLGVDAYRAPQTARRMADAAAALLEAVNEGQRSVLQQAFTRDGVRREWSYLPLEERPG